MRIINLDKIISKNKFPQFLVLSVLVLMLATSVTVGVTQQRRVLEVKAAQAAKENAAAKESAAKKKAEEAKEQVESVSSEVKSDLPTTGLDEEAIAKQQAELAAMQAALDEQAAQTAAQSELQAQIAASEAQIQPGAYPIMGLSSVSVEQMVSFFNANCGNYPSEALGAGGAPDIQTFVQMYYEEASAEGVRPEVAFTQTMKETGWLQYGGDSTIQQYNFAGLGTTGGGVQGVYFPDVRTGIRAQIQHLKAYASDEALIQSCVDERYDYVSKGCSPFVEWLGQQENPSGSGWAVSPGYGTSIVDMINNLRSY